MEVNKFTEKLNKVDGIIHTIEEEVIVTDGVYEGTLEHDNINEKSLNVYTGSKLTGEKITNLFISTPSDTPWKRTIKIFSNVSPVYISYETPGDQVEAEDINDIQDAVIDTQNALNSESDRAKQVEDSITNIINTNKPNWDDKYKQSETFTKEEVLQKINDLINGAPNTLDTLNEIATALGNDPNFATTIINILGTKVDKITGKQLSTEDYTTAEKNKLSGVQSNANNYTHPSTHPASMITEDSTHRFVTDEEKTNWNTVANSIPYVVATGSNNVYSITLTPIPTAYEDGMIIRVKFNVASTGAISIKANSLVAKSVVDYFGNPVTNVRANLIANLCYEATSGNFILLGKGGGGDLVEADLLEGKKGTGDNGLVVGTMPNNGSVTANLTNNNQEYTIPAGFHNGLGKIKALITNLAAAVIKAGTTVGGIIGTFTADATAVAADIIAGKIAYVNGLKVIGSLTDNYNTDNITAATSVSGTTLKMTIPTTARYRAGYHLQATDADFIAAYIMSGKNIFGVAGTLIPSTFKTASVPFTMTGPTLDVSSLVGFTPKIVFGMITGGSVRGTLPLYFSAINNEAGDGCTNYYKDNSTASEREWKTVGGVPDFSNLVAYSTWSSTSTNVWGTLWAYTW